MTAATGAAGFIERLKALSSDTELEKHRRYFKLVDRDPSSDNYFIGVRMGSIFVLAKDNASMPVPEIEKLMESPIHEARVGAMSIHGPMCKRPEMHT